MMKHSVLNLLKWVTETLSTGGQLIMLEIFSTDSITSLVLTLFLKEYFQNTG